jgi:hypothetical protein
MTDFFMGLISVIIREKSSLAGSRTDACRPHGIAVDFEQDTGMSIVRLRKAQAKPVALEVVAMLAAIRGEMSRSEIQRALGFRDKKHFRENYQQVAVALGLSRRNPEKRAMADGAWTRVCRFRPCASA